MNTGEGRTIYFLGIGGIGMSALARYYHSQGYQIAGYDRTPSPLTKQLENEGMAIHYEDNPKLLPALIEIAIYTPAVPSSLNELDALRQRSIPILKRSEALGKISEGHARALLGIKDKTKVVEAAGKIIEKQYSVRFDSGNCSAVPKAASKTAPFRFIKIIYNRFINRIFT